MISIFKKQPRTFSFMFFCALIALYVMPIILTGRLYIDDLGRTLYGYSGWGSNGRPLSDAIMQSMSLGGELLDLSPLNQILSVLILCIALYYYAAKFFGEISFIGSLVICFLFIANPFYIENLSYRFDSLTMALSMVLLLIPYSVASRRYISDLFSILMIIGSLSLYQASIGLFAILALIESITTSNKGNKHIASMIARRVMQLFIAFLIYKTFISSYFVDGYYNITHSEVIKLSHESLSVLIENIKSFLWFLNSYFHSMPVALRVLIPSAIAYSTIKMAYEIYKIGSKDNAIALLILILSPFLVLVFSIAPMAILKSPVFAPRVLLSFSGAAMFYAFLMLRNIKSPVILTFIFAPLVWISFVYSYSFSNASKSQSITDEIIATSVFQEISHHEFSLKYVAVNGEMPKSRQLLMAENKLPLMSRLVPVYLSYDWVWGAELLNHYGMNLEFKVLGSEKKNMICKSTLITKGSIYSLYSFNDILIIDFLRTKC
ncbi:glucosyltransferase domain-containing protein [Escherichia coli]